MRKSWSLTTGKKYLIVNADDFGQSPGVNQGIIEAHEHGIVTSASLMTRWLAAGEAALYARSHPELSVGIHLDFGEWICQGEDWVPLYSVVPLEDESVVERETYRQLEQFRYLVGKDPSHINSHQHVHLREPLRSIALHLSETIGAPLRNLCPGIHYFMDFYGQTTEGQPFHTNISVERLMEALSTLPDGPTVLCCHPGHADDLNTPYKHERAQEVKALCDPRVRQAIASFGITLCSFEEWNRIKESDFATAD
jgi:predicted glycoside hydrolase/deacetylase ChbG (UPF0249 family)